MPSYPVYYPPSGCGAQIPDHFCTNCGSIENARVRSIAFIKKTKVFADPSSSAEWTAAIAAKDVIIIPATNGTFDGGAEVESDGYGDQISRLNGYNFTLQFQDPDYLNHNGQFYNELKRSRNYTVAYRTETQLHFSDKVVEVIPKNPVTAAPTDAVVFDVTVKWANDDIPVPHDIPPGIFDQCFDYV